MSSQKEDLFDVCVIGCGSAGFAAAMRAVDLGMRAAGPQVSNTIMGISYLIDQDKGIADVLKTVHPHPTLSEGVQECIRVLLGTSIYKPEVFPDWIKIRTWKPNDEHFKDGAIQNLKTSGR